MSPTVGCVSFLVRPLLAASVIAVAPIASIAEVGSFARCYGDTVEIELLQSPTGISTVRLSVPSENVAIVNLHDGTPLFEDSPCGSEPRVARRLTGGFFSTSLGSRAAEELANNGVAPRFFQLFPRLPDSVNLDEARRLAAVEAAGIDQPEGLRVVYDRENPGQMNLVRLPLAYRTPGGAPVVMSCNFWLSCEVSYALGPALSLRYEILNVSSRQITAQWVEIDRGVRSTLLSWINRE